MSQNKKKTAAVLLAGCLITSSVVPVYAVEGPQIVESSTDTVKVSLNDGLHRENVTDVTSNNPGVSATWNVEEQVFELSKTGDDVLPFVTLTWKDEFSGDRTANGEEAHSSISIMDTGDGYAFASSCVSVDKSQSVIRSEEGTVFVSVAGGLINDQMGSGQNGAEVLLYNKDAEDLSVPAFGPVFCEFGNEVSIDAMVDGEYDVYARDAADGRYWKLGMVSIQTEETPGSEDDAIASQLHLTDTIEFSKNGETYNGLFTFVESDPIDGYDKSKLKLSSTKDVYTEIVGSTIASDDICFVDIPVSAGIDPTKEPVYLFYGTALIGQLNKAEETPAPEDPLFSLEDGSELVFSFASSSPSDQDTAADTIRILSDKELTEMPIGSDFTFSSTKEGKEPIQGMQVSGISAGSDNQFTVSVSASYGSSKGLKEVHLFYKDQYVGSIPISNILATKTVVTLGEDRSVDLVFEAGAAAEALMSDSIDCTSNTPISSGKFSLKKGEDAVSNVNFIVTSGKLNITCRRDMVPGEYDLYYDGELVGQITISITEKEDGNETEISITDSYVDFSYPHYVQDGDKANGILNISVKNPKEDLVQSKFSLGSEAGTNEISSLTKNEDGSYSLVISHTYKQSESNLMETGVFYDGIKIGTVYFGITVSPNNDGYTVTEIHDMLARVQGEDIEQGIPPTASLPYDESYAEDKAAQAAALEPKMQAWIDDVAANYGYTHWTGAKIEFSYDQEKDQFKSVIKLRDAVSSAKVWNVTVQAKPIPEEKPSIGVSSVNLMEGSTQNIEVSLGSGNSAAKKATISVGNTNMVSVNTTELNAENIANGLVLTGLKAGTTSIDVVFDDAAQTSFHIPVVVNAKTFTINASVNNEAYGSIKSSILNFDGTVEAGQSITFTFEPKDGYKVEEILVDNVKTQVQNNQYTFENVQENHTIFVQFAEDETEADVLPNVTPDELTVKVGKNEKLTLSLGSGRFKAKSATVIVKNPDKLSVSKKIVTEEDVLGGITVTGLESGETEILISFDNESKTTIEIPVTVKSASSGGGGSSGGGSSSVNRKPEVSHNNGGEVTVMSNNKTVVITPDAGYQIKDVIVNGKSVGKVSRYEFKTASKNNRIEVIFERISDPVNPPVDPGYVCPFVDIRGHWAEQMITEFAKTGWVAGVTETTFVPDMNMTRGMFVTILGRMEGAATNQYSHFADVDPKAYYSKYVAWAYSAGITYGVDANHFKPNQNISRQEMAVMVCRYLEYKGRTLSKSPSQFADDNQIGAWAKDSVYALAGNGIVAGKGGNRFDPNASATRAELVTVLYRTAIMLGKLR